MNQLDYLKGEIEATQINLFVGGRAKRMNGELKCLLQIGGKTLLERCLRQYHNVGYRRFNVLGGYGFEKIREYVERELRPAFPEIQLEYSIDDESWKAGGKAKALKYALQNSVVDKTKRSINGFPDDVFLDDSMHIGSILSHLSNVKKGCEITVVAVKGTRYPYGVLRLDESDGVMDFDEKPFIEMLTSTGQYIFEPYVYDRLEMIDLESAEVQEFEDKIVKPLAREGKVGYHSIDHQNWISINTQKELETAISKLGK